MLDDRDTSENSATMSNKLLIFSAAGRWPRMSLLLQTDCPRAVKNPDCLSM